MYYEKKLPKMVTTDQRCLIFLHGGGGNGKLWHHQITHFSRQYEVITVDLPGSGRSSKNISPATAVQAIAGVMREFIGSDEVANERITLIGHSFAGTVMSTFLDKPPAGLDSLVFVDSTFISNMEEAKRRSGYARRLLALSKKIMVKEVERWYESMMGWNLVERERKLILEALNQVNTEWLLQVMACSPEYYRQFNPSTLEPQLSITPGIIESDFFAGNRTGTWRNFFKNCYYSYLEGTAHFLFMERPNEFNKSLEYFLKELARTKEKKKG
jgi:pimeloyl-ACP methyl ester carboxylesterase